MGVKGTKLIRFFSFLFPKQDRESLKGDFEEIYLSYRKDNGVITASLKLLLNLIKSIPVFFMDAVVWRLSMLSNFIKFAMRNINKTRGFTMINVLGLSLALGCSIVAVVFFDFNYNRDSFHEKADNIVLIQNISAFNGKNQMWGTTPAPLGPAMKDEISHVKDYSRIAFGSVNIKRGERILKEYAQFVDNSFFRMFSYPLRKGKLENLNDNEIVLTQEMSEKYFGKENPLGRNLTIIMGEKNPVSFRVAAVIDKPVGSTVLKLSIMIPIDNYGKPGINELDRWGTNVRGTYIEFDRPENAAKAEKYLEKYVELQNSADKERPVDSFFFTPLTEISRNSWKVKRSVCFARIQPGQLFIMFAGSLFLLALAIFNYINIALASATGRMKEIGVRKVMGCRRRDIISQFLGENLIICTVSMIMGILMAKYFFTPWFVKLFPGLDFEVNLLANANQLLYIIILLPLVGFLVGFYPSFYISGFQPVNILKDRQKITGRRKFTKVLMGIQLILCVINISNTFIFIKNSEYQLKREWGYQQKNSIVVPVSSERYAKLRDVAVGNQDVVSVAGSMNYITGISERAGLRIEGKKYEAVSFSVGYNYLENMGVEFEAGKGFSDNLNSSETDSVVINETFAENAGWSNPVGKTVLINSKLHYIRGVVKDFHYQNFMRKIEPVIFRLCGKDQYRYMSVRVNEGKGIEVSEFLRKKWLGLYPDDVYSGFFQDQAFDPYYHAMKGVADYGIFSGIITLIITCIGLVGMIHIRITRIRKELSIRKVLGAPVLNLIKVINRDLIVLLLIAGVLGVFSGYIMASKVLESLWVYYVEIGVAPFVNSYSLIIFAIALLLSGQVYKAVKANPAKTLKEE